MKQVICGTGNNLAFAEFDPMELEQSIAQRFADCVARFSDRIAVVTTHSSWSYQRLDQVSNHVAHRLSGVDRPAAEPVALLMNQGIEFVITALAAIKTGSPFVALDPRDCPQTLVTTLDHVGAQVLITDRINLGITGSLEGYDGITFVIEPPYAESEQPSASVPGPESLAYIYYTSGSTGRPKGVYDNHRNVLHNILRYTSTLQIRPDDRLSMVQSPSFSGCVSNLFGALLNGATLCPFDLTGAGLSKLSHWMRDRGITIYHSVPSVFRQLARPQQVYPAVRLIRLEGDRAQTMDLEVYRQHFSDRCRLVNGFGATECGLARQFFVDKTTTVPGSAVPIGYAVPGVEMSVVDESGKPANQGEIEVASPFLALGYWRRPELTRQAFRTVDTHGLRVYRTGDMGRINTTGCIEHLGRVGGQTRISGETVDLEFIQATLAATGIATEWVVRRWQTRSGVDQLVAYYVPMDRPLEDLAGFRHQVSTRMRTEWIPLYFVDLPEMPLTRDGKVDSDKLPAPDMRHRVRGKATDPAHDKMESTLATLWSAVLDIDTVTARDDVFDLGADSLAVASFIDRAHEVDRIHVDTYLIYQHRTPRALARALTQPVAEDSNPDVNEARSRGARRRLAAARLAQAGSNNE